MQQCNSFRWSRPALSMRQLHALHITSWLTDGDELYFRFLLTGVMLGMPTAYAISRMARCGQFRRKACHFFASPALYSRQFTYRYDVILLSIFIECTAESRLKMTNSSLATKSQQWRLGAEARHEIGVNIIRPGRNADKRLMEAPIRLCTGRSAGHASFHNFKNEFGDFCDIDDIPMPISKYLAAFTLLFREICAATRTQQCLATPLTGFKQFINISYAAARALDDWHFFWLIITTQWCDANGSATTFLLSI